MNSNGAELKGSCKEAECNELTGKSRLAQTLLFSGSGRDLLLEHGTFLMI